MTIGIPDALTANESEKCVMSIRLRPDGLSFAVHNPAEPQSFFIRHVAFDGKTPYTTALKDCFFANECLLWPYKRIHTLWVTPQYTLAPREWVKGNGKRLLSFTLSAPETRCLCDETEKDNVLYAVNDDAYTFCVRSLTRPMFTHHITPQLKAFARQSRTDDCKRMYVVLHDRLADITCFAQGRTLLANTFPCGSWSDGLYFVLYVWRQAGMNEQNDRLYLTTGDPATYNRLTKALRAHIRHVGKVQLPVNAHLIGGEISQAPTDLLLLLCE